MRCDPHLYISRTSSSHGRQRLSVYKLSTHNSNTNNIFSKFPRDKFPDQSKSQRPFAERRKDGRIKAKERKRKCVSSTCWTRKPVFMLNSFTFQTKTYILAVKFPFAKHFHFQTAKFLIIPFQSNLQSIIFSWYPRFTIMITRQRS